MTGSTVEAQDSSDVRASVDVERMSTQALLRRLVEITQEQSTIVLALRRREVLP